MTTSTSPTTSIPIIDIGPYLDGSDKQGVADQIGKACEEIGFFMIKGHGVSTELLKSLQSSSQNFFDLPVDIKSQTMAPFGLGYMGMGKENVAQTLKSEEQANKADMIKDYKESLNLVLPIRDEVWPKNEELRTLCSSYYNIVLDLATKLMRLFALALKLEESYFDDKVDKPYTTLRLLNYPEFEVTGEKAAATSTADVQTTRNAEHTDYGTLTVLWSSDSRGLQARSRDGQWIHVVAPSDCFIINIGDLMMNWTNDKWVSTLHRVVPHPDTLGQRRMSMPFFHNPNPDAIIECIPSCCLNNDQPPKYKPMLAKEHLEMKVSKALGQEEKMSDDLKQ